MLNRAFELRFNIDEVVKDQISNGKNFSKQQEIKEDEWIIVYLLLDFLKPFHDSTKMLESKNSLL